MSSLTTLARPYARAAFAVARKNDALAAWEGALHVTASISEDAVATDVIKDPTVADEVQQAFVQPPGDTPEGFEAFLALLVQYDRLRLLPQIAVLFSALKDEAEGTLAVTVRSASELADDYRQALTDSLGKRFGKQIDLTVEVDQTMLGGAVIEAGDLVIDGSVRGKLSRLATTMQAG